MTKISTFFFTFTFFSLYFIVVYYIFKASHAVGDFCLVHIISLQFDAFIKIKIEVRNKQFTKKELFL